ncbi:hypothetical protein [Paenibacillus sp. FJAT-26967]|uniref:hypothetical protein n=1 Tax=Paenibacillus sp. FJAT-26967 TaxID=1729690 RepID=UPI000837E173|nr:hypothetical protein [Paenibacillus sp. FJAT-26967]
MSKKRPIPKAKLETLSKMFQIEEEYFQKELNEVEKIEIQLDYLRRLSNKEAFKMPDFIVDDDGNKHKVMKWIDPYEDERRLLQREYAIETVILQLRSSLYSELYNPEFFGDKNYLWILQELSSFFMETSPEGWSDERKETWVDQQKKRASALRMLLNYFNHFKIEHEQFMREQSLMDDDLHDFVRKHDLIRSKNEL